MSNCLQPHEPEHATPPCPSPTPGDHSDSRPSIPSSHLILCRPLLLLPLIPPSIRVFSTESSLHMRWPKYWSCSFSFSIIPSKEHPGLISFRWTGWISLQSKGLSGDTRYLNANTSLFGGLPRQLSGRESSCQRRRWEGKMATHSSTLVWKVPWTEELERPQLMGWQRVGHHLVTRPQQKFI